jgi:RNA polymerase sigma-70 factor, ECF subfamily
MDERDLLAARFEEERPRLRAVAYRMLGSAAEAEDAVQEAWLRLARSDAGAVNNLAGWLTTVVGRVCLDMLRSRTSRREAPLESETSRFEPPAAEQQAADPEQQAVLADSLGLALLVVLDMLDPAERLAFVLHDMFAVPYDEIAPIVDRTPAAARQLASRARRQVQGSPPPGTDLARQREIVGAFLAAARGGDFDALVTLLDPDVVFRGNGRLVRRGAATVARGSSTFAATAAVAPHLILVNGTVGAVAFAGAHRYWIATYAIVGGRISEINVITDPALLRQLDLGVLD